MSCRHHLDHEHAVALVEPAAGRPPAGRAGRASVETCAIDVAIRSQSDVAEIATLLGISERWVRAIVASALDRVAVALVTDALAAAGIEADVWCEARPAADEICLCLGDGEVIRMPAQGVIDLLAAGEFGNKVKLVES